jgi:PAS domain S-box-containing protein
LGYSKLKEGIAAVEQNLSPAFVFSNFSFQMFMIAFVTITIDFFLIFLLSKSVSDPLKALSKGMKKVSEGDLGYQVEILSNDELGLAAQGFNNMATKLSDSHQKTKESEEKYRNLVKTANDAIFVVDVETGKIIEVNKKAEELLGLPTEEIIGMHQTQLYPKEEAEHYVMIFQEVVQNATKEEAGIEAFIVHKDGHKIPVEISVSITTLEGKKIIQGIFRNITERKKAEEQTEKTLYEKEMLLNKLEQKNEELESFVYTMSHDLKAPLISINGFASLLKNKQKEKLSDDSRFYFERIVKNTEIMRQTIDDLLELSRIGKIEEEIKPIKTEELVREIENIFQPHLNQKNIQLKIAAQLPTIHCERTKIFQVFNNLIGNAIKFSRDIPNPTITITVRNQIDYYQFGVIDNGIGVEKDYHKKIFDLFSKLEPSIEGSGLGLAIVKKVVNSWNGKIWVESDTGKGAAFYFTIPKQEQQGS